MIGNYICAAAIIFFGSIGFIFILGIIFELLGFENPVLDKTYDFLQMFCDITGWNPFNGQRQS